MSVHSQWINNALVFYDTYRMRWLDAIGANVVKYIYNGAGMGTFTDFTSTAVSVGAGTSTPSNAVEAGDGILLTNAANENDGLNIQLLGESFQLEASKPLYTGAKIKISDATQSDLLWGLCITDTTLLAGMSEGIYFECLDAGTTISYVLENGSTETQADSATAMDTSYHIYEFYWDGAAVHAYLDGTEETIAAQTNKPAVTVDLTPSIHFLNGEAAVKTANIAWWRTIQLR